MLSAFRAAHTSSAGIQLSQPGVFDILAQQSQAQSLKPALKYVLKFVGLWLRNKTFSRTLQWFEELYALVMLLLENYFLKKYGASFTENFYSMKRVFVNGSNAVSEKAQRLRSLIFLVLVPYIEGKLSSYREKIENIDPHLRTPFMNFFYKWYPIVNKLMGIIGIGFLVLYAFGYVNVQSLPLYLIGARLDRLTPEDVKSFESVPTHMQSGFLGRASRLALQVPSWTGRFFSYALFFKDVLEFTQQQTDEQSNKFTFDNFAKPVHPLRSMSEAEILHMDAGKCPLCHKRRDNDTVLSVSGYVFCFSCINNFVRQRRQCPITGIPASPEQLIRLYRKSG